MQAQQLVAHRGYQKHYPENSLTGIRAALTAGARWVEIDVQLTADLVPVIIHDHHSLRVGGRCDILRTPWQRIKNCAIHEPQRFGRQFLSERIAPLSALPALFAEFPAAQCFVELKIQSIHAFGSERCLAAIHHALGTFNPRCILISFDHQTLIKATQANFPRIAPVLSDWRQLEQCQQLLPQAEYVFCDYKKIPAGHIVSDIPIALYEVHEDRVLAQTLLARGATLIETFAIGEMLSQLQM